MRLLTKVSDSWRVHFGSCACRGSCSSTREVNGRQPQPGRQQFTGALDHRSHCTRLHVTFSYGKRHFVSGRQILQQFINRKHNLNTKKQSYNPQAQVARTLNSEVLNHGDRACALVSSMITSRCLIDSS